MIPLPHALELMLSGVQPRTRAQVEAWNARRPDAAADLSPEEADEVKRGIDWLERAALAQLGRDRAPDAVDRERDRANVVADIKAGLGRGLGEAAEAASAGTVRRAVRCTLGGIGAYVGWRLLHGIVRDVARTRRYWRGT